MPMPTIEELERMTKEANMSEIQSWADRAMFHAEPHENYIEGRGVQPKVRLLNMTNRPLHAVAAMAAMYTGKVIRDYDDMDDDFALQAWKDSTRTHLTAPLEAVKFQFQIDGVDRAFTHQMVRQRTAVYAQESMRFAVVDDLPHNTTLAPWFHGEGVQQREMRELHNELMKEIGRVYNVFIQNGCPAEDARSVLPHNVATRLIYDSNLRNLADHAGNRLCTQAQFHWRQVWNQIVHQIRVYGEEKDPDNAWQYHVLASSSVFRPVCYQLGRCPFNASFDRACTMRDRVERLAARAVPSDRWDTDPEDAISPVDWLLNESAARER